MIPGAAIPYSGIPLVRYDGDNGDEILEALRIRPGDAILSGETPILIRFEHLEALIRGDDPGCTR